MKHRIFTGIIYLIIANSSLYIYSQDIVPDESNKGLPSQNIRGRVIDKDSKAALPLATIVINSETNPVGTFSDMEGNFILEDIPVGRYTLKVTSIGYNPKIIPELLLGSGKELIVEIELTEQVHKLNEVIVSTGKGQALNQMATISARSFSVEETKRYAASICDPARMAQAFAGVSGGDDNGNDIIIRGNSPGWMLWRLEGVEIPVPNHFVEDGYSAGKVSILSTNIIDKSDFYTGAFPAEYGNALSGVFDIKLRKGNSGKKEFTFQAGILGVDLAAEGPFSKNYNGSYLVNYRYSTFSLLKLMNIEITENALPDYQDLSFKIHLPTKKAGIFSVWGIGGISDVREEFLPDTTLNELLSSGYRVSIGSDMYACGITHTYFPDQKSYIKTVVSNSMSSSSQEVDKMDTYGVYRGDFYDDLGKSSTRINSFYNRKVSNRLTVRTGATLSNIRYDYYTRENTRETGWTDILNSKGQTNTLEAFIQSRYRLSDNLSATTGMHYSHFGISGDNSFEPRAALNYNTTKAGLFSFGYGRHSKNESLPVYFVEKADDNGELVKPNSDLKMTRSDHYVASWEKKINQNVLIKTELYYQYISKLAVPANPENKYAPFLGAVPQYDTLVNNGKGRNYGIELTLQRFFTGDFYFLITSSLFDSKYMPSDGKWYNTKYNTRFINNLVAGKEISLSGNKMISLNARAIWSGGKRLIPVDLEASIEAGEKVYSDDAIYETQAKDYFRLDLGLKMHFYGKHSEQVLSLDLQNATNRFNTWFTDYDPVKQELYDYPMAGLIPVLNYRIEF